jgi:hypothetical protein
MYHSLVEHSKPPSRQSSSRAELSDCGPRWHSVSAAVQVNVNFKLNRNGMAEVEKAELEVESVVMVDIEEEKDPKKEKFNPIKFAEVCRSGARRATLPCMRRAFLACWALASLRGTG